jgi:lipopolysaccharide export system permease protein
MQNGRLGVMVAAEGHTEVDASGNRFVILENGRRYEGTPGTPSYRVMEFERYQIRMESKEAASGPASPEPWRCRRSSRTRMTATGAN